MATIAEFASGFPGISTRIPFESGFISEVLAEHGYNTYCVGKWHLAPAGTMVHGGPRDRWPLGRGFERFYGFLGGETNSWYPDLVHDNHQIDPPATPEEGYHLSEDLVDQAIRMVHDSVSLRPDRPFFTYLAFGATHAPHQSPPEYLAKYRGRFDDGWDEARQRWYERQLELGVIPEGTDLAPRNPGVEPWDTLPENHKVLANRLQEAFAAFLDHTDAQIGRFVDALDRLGQLDNTIIFVLSDNGASQEGGPFGVLHEMKFFNFLLETPDEAVDRLDDIGGPHSHANYPWGWAQVGNTPFKWYKQNTHEGGVHVPLVGHWPAGIDDAGGLRHQFHYVSDVVPTIYELLGVEPPEVYRGYEQLPVTGTSMRYALDDAAAPTRKEVQYFEMMGHRALVLDGWKAVTRHDAGTPFDEDVWELYHLDADRSECHDLADQEPERLAAMVERWWEEAEEHGVFPLDDRTIELFGARFRHGSPHPESRRYVYRPPMTRIPPQVAATLGGRSWDLTASVERPVGAGGVLYALGNENSGLSLFVKDDRLWFDYNCFGEHHVVTSSLAVPEGSCQLGVRFRRSGDGGWATVVVDGEAAGTVDVPFVMRMVSSVGTSVGRDEGSPVSEAYTDEFAFEGRLDRVEIQLLSPKDVAAEQAAAEDAAVDQRTTMSRQ
jgi:arylsulfatase